MEHLIPGIWYSTFRDGWNDEVEEDLVRKGFQVTKHEHLTGPLTRWLLMERRAKALAAGINQSQGFVRVWAHSNGNEIFCRALPHLLRPVDEVHMFAAACSSDFNSNGLNAALKKSTVRQVWCHQAEDDRVLAGPAKWSRWAGGWLGLGFGDLGLSGPQNIQESVKPRVHSVIYPGYGHSDFWTPENLQDTIHRVLSA